MDFPRLETELLRSVSRSFYLSLRLLPREVRAPVSLAYLLARATDTIADTSEAPVDARRRMLPLLARVIAGEQGADALDTLRFSFAPLQTKIEERELIESLPDCIEWLVATDEADRDDIRAVLAKIMHGQTLDLERFHAEVGEIRALSTGGELEEYTYLVAGCVGEFWTRICARKLPTFSTRSEAEMIELGIAFGKGLQLTNILRDAGADLRKGRCYLPADELIAAGLQPADLLNAPHEVMPVFTRWRERAEGDLRAGIEYASYVQPARVRIATALPALLGLRTLKLLERTGAESFSRHVKISRAEVRSLLFRALLSRASPEFLRRVSGSNSAASR